MWYWNQANFEGLISVADSISGEPEWSDFAAYCRLRERGLRKDALASIDRFMKLALSWPVPERRRFVTWLYDTQQSVPQVHQLVIQPLRCRFALPTLEAWSLSEPSNSVVWRLLGTATANTEHFGTALDLDPADNYSRFQIILRLLQNVSHQCHHLPDYFIGEPVEALQDLATAQAMASEFVDTSIPEALASDIQDLQNKINDWQTFLATGEESFSAWCSNNNRSYTWCKAYYYDT